MNVTMEASKDVALFVEILVLPMHTIVGNVSSKKKTETDALKLSTWGRQKRTYFMNERSMDSKKDRIFPLFCSGLVVWYGYVH